MIKSSSNKYRKFAKDGKEYLYTQYDLLRINVLEKISSIAAVLVMIMIGIVILVSVWVYVSFILIVCMERVFDSYIIPVVIMISANLLLLALIIKCREGLILNPLIKVFSKVLFDNSLDDDDFDDDDDDNDDDDYENKN